MRPYCPVPLCRFALAVLATLCALTATVVQGRELRRSMPFIRPYLMGDAYVAVADEASTLLYNPAALAGLPNKSVSAFVPQLTVDDQLLDAVLDPQSLQDKYSGLDENSLRDLAGTTINSNFNIPMPFVALPNNGLAFGLGLDLGTSLEVLDNPIGPNLDLEFYFDRVLFFTLAGRVNEQLDIGITPKLINRSGIHKILRFGELFASGATLNFDNDPAFNDLANGVSFTTAGLDLGLLWRLPVWPAWHPRIGFSALNLGGLDEGRGFRGMEFGQRPIAEDPPQAGLLPQINTLGFAVSPIYNGIRYTVALDIVDVTATVLPGDDLLLRSRLGVEIGIGVRKDGTALLSLLGGYNATHSSLGILSRVWIFEVGLGTYTVERGEKAGDIPDNRNVLVFGFRI